MTFIIILALIVELPGDFRVRYGLSWPSPEGIEENSWHGDNSSFYQRLRFCPDGWEAVVFTEKDPGETFGDLVAAGIQYNPSQSFSTTAGALRVQFAQGLLLSNSGGWSSSNPLSLSKPVAFRIRLDPAESPGAADGNSLTGVSSIYKSGIFSAAALLGWSHTDTGTIGLHRSQSELDNRGNLEEKLGAFRTSLGPVGFSVVQIEESEDSTVTSGTRLGADLFHSREEAVVTGEFVSDLHSAPDFVLSAGRGIPDFRHCITVSRNTLNLPRTAGSFGTSHNIAAGYGVRWRVADNILSEAGIIYLHGEDEDRLKAGIMFSETPGNRTEFTQRIKYSETGQDQTLSGRITARWSPVPEIVLSTKIPLSRYTSPGEQSSTGYGVEVRLRYKPSPSLDWTVSAASCSTDGWESRVYAYSLSFPGEFGSAAMYNNSVLLQMSVSLHISDSTVLRAKTSWYRMEDAESLGTGDEETEGPERTEAGIQLDWDFR